MKYREFNSVFLYNLLLSLKNKWIISNGVILILITFIVNTVLVIFVNSEGSIVHYTVIKSILFYVQTIFGFFFVFSIIFFLFRTQKDKGLNDIETRSGINPYVQFLIRYLTYFVVLSLYLIPIAVLFVILDFGILSAAGPEVSEFYIWSNYLYQIIFSVTIFPVIFILVAMFKATISISLNIILILSIIFVPIIQFMIINPNSKNDSNLPQLKNAIEYNLKVKYANEFYDQFIEDKNINAIFNDSDELNESIFIKNIINNYSTAINNCGDNINILNWINELNFPGASFEYNECYEDYFLKESLYSGATHIAIDFNQENQSVYSISNTKIFKIIDEIHQVVFNGWNKNKVTNFSTTSIDFSNFINRLLKYPQLDKYKNLFNFANSFYKEQFYLKNIWNENLQNIIFFNYNEYLGQHEKILSDQNYDSKLKSVNQKMYEFYNEVPEIKVLNWILIQNWLNLRFVFNDLESNKVNFSNDYNLYNSSVKAVKKYISIVNKNILNWYAYTFMSLLSKDEYWNLYAISSVSMSFGVTKFYKNADILFTENSIGPIENVLLKNNNIKIESTIDSNIIIVIQVLLSILITIVAVYIHKILIFKLKMN